MIAEAVRNAEQGVEVSEDVAAILREITQGANHVNALVAEIAAASKEQATGIGQVNSAMTQLDKVTQQNAANAEGSASAAAELNGQADRLQDLLATFRLTGSQRSRDDASRAAVRQPGAAAGRPAGDSAVSPRAGHPSSASTAAVPRMPPPAPGEAAMDEGVFQPF
jgi:methyl-accepting chemotaxis protein